MGGWNTNECGKFTACTEEEIKSYQKQRIERLKTQIENSEGSEKAQLQNRLLMLKQQNRPFYKKHSDTIRTIVIIGAAYYLWKSGLLTKNIK